MADEDEAGEALARSAKGAADALGIGAPSRHPAGDIAEGVRRKQQVHRGGAARQLLLPDRDLVIRDRGRDEDDELPGIMGELVLLLVMGDRRAGIVLDEGLPEQRAQRVALV